MIIDAHVHLPVGKDCNILCRKREKLLRELERNHIDRCIVISDSCMESDIGNLDECVELFRESVNVNVVAEVARQYPNLKLVCCHCFFPKIDKCLLLVKYPNVYFDISSIADNKSILNDIEEKIKKLIEVVPERILFGSDYSGCSQEEHVQFVKNLRLNKMLTKYIFEDNAKYVFNLKAKED